MKLSFSTDDVPYRDRIAFWQDVACKAFVELDCQPMSRASFTARIRSGTVSHLGVSLVETDASKVTRSRSEIARSESDDILVSVQLAGTTVLSQGDRVVDLRPGQFALYDTQRPYSLLVGDNSRQLVLKVPRQMLESRIGSLGTHMAQRIDGQSPFGGLALGYFNMLPSQLKSLDEGAARLAAEQALELLASSCLRTAEGYGRSLSSSSKRRLQHLKFVVDANLGNYQLTPVLAARLAGMSVRYANKLLAAEDQSLERYIFHRRLEASRRALIATPNGCKSISEIAFAHGFSSAAHFSRRFKEAFGMTPTEYRKSLD